MCNWAQFHWDLQGVIKNISWSCPSKGWTFIQSGFYPRASPSLEVAPARLTVYTGAGRERASPAWEKPWGRKRKGLGCGKMPSAQVSLSLPSTVLCSCGWRLCPESLEASGSVSSSHFFLSRGKSFHLNSCSCSSQEAI